MLGSIFFVEFLSCYPGRGRALPGPVVSQYLLLLVTLRPRTHI